MISPCRACDNEFRDKMKCAAACKRLAAFQEEICVAETAHVQSFIGRKPSPPPVEELKECGSCHVHKPLTEFHRNGDGLRSYCKQCTKEAQALTIIKMVICSRCGREMPHVGRGLCGGCYWHARKAEKAAAIRLPGGPDINVRAPKAQEAQSTVLADPAERVRCAVEAGLAAPVQEPDRTGMKECRRCGEWRPLDRFYPINRSKKYYHSYCKDCMLRTHAERRRAHAAAGVAMYARKLIVCAACGRQSFNHGRGLCSRCYRRARAAETRASAQASGAGLPICASSQPEQVTVSRDDSQSGRGSPSPKRRQKRSILKCRACGERRPHVGRGLCGRCYYWVRQAERAEGR